MKFIRLLVFIALGLGAWRVFGQTNQPPPSPAGGLYSSIASMFDLNNTNSLVHANEINVTPLMLWDVENKRIGGALDLNWWVTDQQGAVLRYAEFEDREAFWSVGYKARTVFASLEIGFGAGITQSTDDPLGANLEAYIQPSLSWKVPLDKVDLRLYLAADVYQNAEPMIGIGGSLRFFK